MKPQSVAFGTPHNPFDQHFKLLHDHLILFVVLILQLYGHYMRQNLSAVVPQSLEIRGQE